MGQVVVTIAGRSFRLACEDGDEPRLASLAQTFDATVSELRTSFGEVGDTRLAVMAGLVMTDKLNDAQAQLDTLTAKVAELQSAMTLMQSTNVGSNDQLRERIDALADRLERTVQRPASAPVSNQGTPST
ncbi:MAG: cell division protein ZapA [Pseudomonadota bacterium]